MSERLPDGWTRALLGNVARCEWGNTSLTKAAYRDSGVTAFSATGPDGLVKDPEHDGEGIVLSAIGANCGKCFFADGLWTAIKNTITIIPRSEVALARFMFFQLNRRELWPKRGGGQPFIGLGDTRELAVSLPPLNEQRRIVAKLEALQARSRRAREALDAVPPLLEKLRQSILAAAFRGDLTKDWRAKHKDVEPASELLKRIRVERRKKWEEAELAKMTAKGKAPGDDTWKAKYEEPEGVDASGLPELPVGWCWARLSQLVDLINGDRGKNYPSQSVLVASGVPFINAGHLDAGEIDLASMNYIPEERYELLGSGKVQPGDVLYCLRGSLGKAAVVRTLERGAIASSLVILRPAVDELTQFIYLFLVSPQGRDLIRKYDNGSAQPNLAASSVEEYVAAIPPLSELRVLVDRIEQALAGARRALASSERMTAMASSLERSILSKAFRGELVPQDPNDEPAEATLARVRGADGLRATRSGRAPTGANQRPRCSVPEERPMTLQARELHQCTDDEARALADAILGEASTWGSALLQYRLTAEFQEDWKAEVGHYFATATRLGILERVKARVLGRVKTSASKSPIHDRQANDSHHRALAAELAPLLVTHYLAGTGWSFDDWEPITGGDIDVDVSLLSPHGRRAFFQVKAPDQPGDVVGYRRVDGEYDERILQNIDRAAHQLPRGGGEVNIVAIVPNRNWPLSLDPECVVRHLIGGATLLESGHLVLRAESRGRFFDEDWRHISAVMLIDYMRAMNVEGVEEFSYPCTVIANPLANVPIAPEWFSRGRVLTIEGSAVRWIRGEPGRAHALPEGTIVDALS